MRTWWETSPPAVWSLSPVLSPALFLYLKASCIMLWFVLGRNVAGFSASQPILNPDHLEPGLLKVWFTMGSISEWCLWGRKERDLWICTPPHVPALESLLYSVPLRWICTFMLECWQSCHTGKSRQSWILCLQIHSALSCTVGADPNRLPLSRLPWACGKLKASLVAAFLLHGLKSCQQGLAHGACGSAW